MPYASFSLSPFFLLSLLYSLWAPLFGLSLLFMFLSPLSCVLCPLRLFPCSEARVCSVLLMCHVSPVSCGDLNSQGDHSPFHDHGIIYQHIWLKLFLFMEWGNMEHMVQQKYLCIVWENMQTVLIKIWHALSQVNRHTLIHQVHTLLHE